MQEADEHAAAMRKVRAQAAASAAALAELTAQRSQDQQHIAVLQSALREAVESQGSLAGLLAVRRDAFAAQHSPAQPAAVAAEAAGSDDPWSWTTSDEEDGLLSGLDLAERGAARALLASPGSGRARTATPAGVMRAASSLAPSRDDHGSVTPRLPATLPRGAVSSGHKSGGFGGSPGGVAGSGRLSNFTGRRYGGGNKQPGASLSPSSSLRLNATGNDENCPPAGSQPAEIGRPQKAKVCCHFLQRRAIIPIPR